MMALLELIVGIIELWCSWRLYLCLAIGLGIAVFLHSSFPEDAWVWFFSVPFAVGSIIVGWRWQRAVDLERSRPRT